MRECQARSLARSFSPWKSDSMWVYKNRVVPWLYPYRAIALANPNPLRYPHFNSKAAGATHALAKRNFPCSLFLYFLFFPRFFFGKQNRYNHSRGIRTWLTHTLAHTYQRSTRQKRNAEAKDFCSPN